jgi:hypothetical protein
VMAEYDEIVSETVKKIMTDIAEHREEIVKAFIAKYGVGPEEVEQVINMSQYASGIITWSIRRKEIVKK